MKRLLFPSLLCLLSVASFGQDLYEFDWKKELAIVGTSGTMVALNFYLESKIERLNEVDLQNLSIDNINRFDRSAVFNNSKASDLASDIFLTTCSIAPLGFLLSDEAKMNMDEIFMMYGETVALNGGLTFLIKTVSRRVRPYVYDSELDFEERTASDSQKSFISGHSSQSAALTFFTAKVFSDLYPDSKFKKFVWAGAIALPAATAYFRFEAGKHFPTDVIAGYTIGAFIGYLIPVMHKTKINKQVNIFPYRKGLALNLTF